DGLARVGAAGGAPRELTKVDATKREFGHWFPQLLPDGEHVLFTIWRTRLRDAQLAVVSLASGERRIVHEGGSRGRYVKSGHLVYVSEGGLSAAPFDLKSLSVRGMPVQVLDDVQHSMGSGHGQFSISQDGSLAYVPGGARTPKNALVQVDRS